MVRVNGWRGVGVMCLGAFAFTRGLAYLPWNVPPQLPGGLQLLVDYSPWTETAYGWAWTAAALCCIPAAFMRRDMWAIAAVMFMTLLAGGSFLVSWLMSFPEPNRDWVTAGSYLGPAGFIFCFSRLINLPRPGSSRKDPPE